MLTEKEKTEIKAALSRLGGDSTKYTLTHNRDGLQNIMVIIYKAAKVYSRRWNINDVQNRNRALPGGITVGSVLLEWKSEK